MPLINLLAVSCGGFAHESPVQNYNAVLALARLQTLCDGIVLINNDHVVQSRKIVIDVTGKSASSSCSAATSGSTMSDVNAEISLSLHGAFLPSASLNVGGASVGARHNNNNSAGGAFKFKSGAAASFNMEPLELIRTLAPMPSHKFLQMDSITPGRESTSLNLVQAIVRTVKRPWTKMEEDSKVLTDFDHLLSPLYGSAVMLLSFPVS